jgi:hypothetical protein
VAALLVLVLVGLEVGAGARLSAATANHQAEAHALAQLGLDRTTAYLNQVLTTQIDLDTALDPGLNSGCLLGGGTTADDHLPLFADGAAVVAGPAGQAWLQVAAGGGSYLVRIDDDDDDRLGLGLATVGNHPQHGCLEGPSFLGPGQENGLRDTNRTVVVTAVGVSPGLDATAAQGLQALRATVGPPDPVGVAVNGDIDLSGGVNLIASNVQAHGNLAVASVQQARVTGTCGATPSCQTQADLPATPRVDPWDILNAPVAGAGTPFYFAAYNVNDHPELFSWNYMACPDPRVYARLCYPTPLPSLSTDDLGTAAGGTLCRACWAPVGQADGGTIRVAGATVWDIDAAPAFGPGPVAGLTAGACSDSEAAPSTGAVSSDRGGDWTPTTVPRNRFSLHGALSGIWVVAGDIRIDGALGCMPASLIALGNVSVDANAQLDLLPAAPRAYVVLAGRDLVLNGNARITSCGAPGATLVHEQLDMRGSHNLLQTQVIVQNAADCSHLASGAPLQGHGNDQIGVPFPAPIPVGPSVLQRDRAPVPF